MSSFHFLNCNFLNGNALVTGLPASRGYGNETVTSIHKNGSLTLNGTRVQSSVHVNGSAELKNAKIYGTININGHADFSSNTHCFDSITVNGTAEFVDTECDSLTTIRGIFTATSSKFESISASSVSLQNSTVTGDVQSHARFKCIGSTVVGVVRCHDDNIVIDNSTIGKLVVEPLNSGSSGISIGGGSTIFQGSGSRNISIIGGVVFVNGVLINPNEARQEPAPLAPQKQVITLRQGSRVGDIVFEGKNGEVIVEEGAELTGSVTGGVVKREGRNAPIAVKVLGKEEYNELCSITLDTFQELAKRNELVEIKCSHKFSRPDIVKWITASSNCPNCKEKASLTDVTIVKLANDVLPAHSAPSEGSSSEGDDSSSSGGSSGKRKSEKPSDSASKVVLNDQDLQYQADLAKAIELSLK